MSDLISRSALLKKICKTFNIPDDWDGNIAEPLQTIIDIIENQPIAYDKEAVVEQLEARRKDYERSIQNASDDVSATYRKGVMRGYEYSKDVVKAGGIDERPKQSN